MKKLIFGIIILLIGVNIITGFDVQTVTAGKNSTLKFRVVNNEGLGDTISSCDSQIYYSNNSYYGQGNITHVANGVREISFQAPELLGRSFITINCTDSNNDIGTLGFEFFVVNEKALSVSGTVVNEDGTLTNKNLFINIFECGLATSSPASCQDLTLLNQNYDIMTTINNGFYSFQLIENIKEGYVYLVNSSFQDSDGDDTYIISYING